MTHSVNEVAGPEANSAGARIEYRDGSWYGHFARHGEQFVKSLPSEAAAIAWLGKNQTSRATEDR